MVLKTVKLLHKKIIFTSLHFFDSTSIYVKGAHTSSQQWKVMFFGSDEFSLGSLSRLHREMKVGKAISKLEIVSSRWHSNPVRLFGQRENLVIHEWPLKLQDVVDFDIGLVASFGHLIPKSIIDAFPLGMINVHGSLLPRWRGAAPVTYAIMHGDSVTGITIMQIQPYAFDKGEIISKREVSISPTETAPQLRARLSEIGGEELISCIRALPLCLVNSLPQPQEGVSYAPKITPELGALNFHLMDAKCIFNRYRALYGVVPIYTTWMGLRLNFHDVSVGDLKIDSHVTYISVLNPAMTFTCDELSQPLNSHKCVPGRVFFDKKCKLLAVICKDMTCLIVGRIAPFKRKPMSAIEFYNGYLSKKDKIDWFFV